MRDPTPNKRKLKIYQDDVKLRHTSHWDADFMTREEFEAYMNGETVCQVKPAPGKGAALENDEGRAGAAPLHERDEHAAVGRAGLSRWERFLRACLPGIRFR
jgi:hypothetical protein